jgi:uncharacterized OB-fold protein
VTALNRPLPVVNDLTRPFWEAAAAGRLEVQRCSSCQYFNHPPREACTRCLSGDLEFEPVSGRGTVWSFSVMHQKSVAGFEEAVPYITALVELEEQPMLLFVTNLPGLDPRDVRIGLPVTVTFEPLAEGIALPQFVPVTGAAG